ncbi:hypothetical protein MNEG_16328 [Monoraphidium neglectum]|uniref:Uncharacterized protein n=1 Tax=Monoraphidium neglectum TaxID=145388 RepID=A0A0D2M861_9CHLO|nr:hypothetical protein MNEG_16328 [Monoraphidium neglectum]KIY91635.1 hypothetical protein MNEG_16328 [Monoraphidium neglectum]|eukprot:XP_013890655.1 hypothetical protein MNEG_16328 [Monoraphidium neglectum]
MNYVLQLVPLAISIIATVVYPKVLKRRWGYDPSDPSTGYPPEDRATLDAGLLHVGGAGGGKLGRVGSTRPLLGSWLLLGHGRSGDALAGAEAGLRPEAGAGDTEDAAVVIGPAQAPVRRGEPRVSASASFPAAGERPPQSPHAAPAAAHSHST